MTRVLVTLISLALVAAPRVARAEQTGSSREQRVREVEELLAAEPTLAQVRDAALQFFAVSPNALDRVRDLARSKAGAPVVIMSARYEGVQASRRIRDVTTTTNADDRFGSHGATGHLTLSWNLPDRVFTPTELQVYPIDEMQRIILRAVNNWYFLRRRLLLILLVDPPEDGRALHALRMRVQGFTALLNAYTGGWFGEHLPEESI